MSAKDDRKDYVRERELSATYNEGEVPVIDQNRVVRSCLSLKFVSEYYTVLFPSTAAGTAAVLGERGGERG